MKCKACGSSNIIKNGKSKNKLIQLFKCKHCDKCFQIDIFLLNKKDQQYGSLLIKNQLNIDKSCQYLIDSNIGNFKVIDHKPVFIISLMNHTNVDVITNIEFLTSTLVCSIKYIDGKCMLFITF